MGLFSKKTSEQEFVPYSFGDTDNDTNLDSLSSSSTSDSEDIDNVKDEDEPGVFYEIDFWKPKRLSKNENILIFKIRDENAEVVGYAIASAIDSFDILQTAFGLFNFDDITYLKEQLEKFCKVYYHKENNE